MFIVRARSTALLCAAVLVAGLACSGSGTSPIVPDVTPTPTSVPTEPPPGGTFCPKGTLTATCGWEGQTFLSPLNDAIDALVAEHPEIFNTSDTAGPGAYRVLDVEGYMQGIVKKLGAAGFCAESRDLQNLQIKTSNDYSERWAIVSSDGFVRRDSRAYRDTCRPARFPVDNADFIDSVRVGFYGFGCPKGVVPPNNNDRKLLMGCEGYVTATPKDKDGNVVPSAIHGTDIAWELIAGGGTEKVRLIDVPQQPFNKILDPVTPGGFSLCATVMGVRGCLDGDVIP